MAFLRGEILWTTERRDGFGFLPSEWLKYPTTLERELFYCRENCLAGAPMTSLITWIFFAWAIGIIVVQFIS